MKNRVESPEVINAWELMEGLEEQVQTALPISKKSPKTPALKVKTPLKLFNQIQSSPRTVKRFGGKENDKNAVVGVLKGNNSCKKPLSLSTPVNNTKSLAIDSSSSRRVRRRSLTPMFDPDLVARYERELSEEKEQVKRIIFSPKTTTTYKSRTPSVSLESILQHFQNKCPPGGENAVVIYTTTLRGIRKTYEDCNTVRSIIESLQVQMYERDVSMDSGFKQELRKLMETTEVKVPVVFVRGRLIGGAEELVKMDEEGKLEKLFEGIPKPVAGGCKGCAGVRFVMCVNCNGSCKVLDQQQKNMVRCDICNENGLIQCPICS